MKMLSRSTPGAVAVRGGIAEALVDPASVRI
jgi:hypothetical protein